MAAHDLSDQRTNIRSREKQHTPQRREREYNELALLLQLERVEVKRMSHLMSKGCQEHAGPMWGSEEMCWEPTLEKLCCCRNGTAAAIYLSLIHI